MKNKFNFLTKESIKSKINTKAFKIINIFLCLLLIILINIDGIIKLFGGDFNELVNIYIYDEANVKDKLIGVMNENSFNLLDSYNAKISETDKNLEDLKKEIVEEESSDIIIHIIPNEEVSIENIFSAEVISYEYIDNLLLQEINSSINQVKTQMALDMSNISDELLQSINKSVNIERVLLNEDLDPNDELMKLVGAIITIIFVMPIFMLIITIVQMIGAEINEEKTSKGMEIIISSVSPQTHFLSKLVSSNLFALLQTGLLIIYGLIGSIIRIFTNGSMNIGNILSGIASSENVNISATEILNLISQSDMLARLKMGIPFFIVLIILTFIVYTLFIGILASITTSMEDFNQIQTPVMIFLMAGYFLAIYSSMFQGSLFLRIMSYIPFISGILSPVMYALGEIAISDLFISIGLLIGTVFLLYKYGLKVYKVGILNYSSSNLWKKIFRALKN
ncbi:MAG: ABC transporter permease [bacterium]|nr:ABC transporter permease [bacterium]